MRQLLFISKGEDSASTRYRAQQFFPLWHDAGFVPSHITASGGARAVWRMLRHARRADIVVILRKTFPRPLLWLLRRTARVLIFDFDDAIFCNTDGSPSGTRMIRFISMVRCCDHVWAGNAWLARQASRFDTDVTIVPTAIDTARYRVTATKPVESVDLVWIGSRSTSKYLVTILPALRRALAHVTGLRLKIIADFDLADCGIPTLAIPWQARTEARELASSHIGVAPMPDNDWTRGKCALKVLQYMAAGLPVISSNAGANAEIVRDGATGFLVDDDDAWVERIVQLASDAALRARLGAEGREHVDADYSIESVFPRMLATLPQSV